MALLDGLGAVEWGRYHHAYGPATDVPMLLHALAFPERAPAQLKKGGKSVFENVTWTLWGNVFHQGSVWGVSAKVIPFLVELFEADLAVEARRFLVTYLHHLATGYPTDLFPRRFEIEQLEAAATRVEAANLPRSVLDGDAFRDVPFVDGEALRNVGAVWMRDCYVGVESRLERLLAGADDVDDEVVGETIALLASFPRRASLTAPKLWELAREETDNPLTGMALVALAQLGQPGVAEAARVVADAVSDSAGVYAAAADVIASKGRPSPASQHRLLAEVPDAWKDLACPFAGSLANLVNRAIVLLPPEALDDVITSLGAALARAKGFGKLDALGALLRVAGTRGTSRLDARARRVIALIAEHADWGEFVNANQANLLRSYGLPDTREALSKLSGSSRSTS